MTVYSDYRIDMQPGRVMDTVYISQYECDWRVLRFKLYYGGTVFNIPDTASAVLSGKKPDGNGFSYTMTVDDENSQVEIAVSEQMSAVAGFCTCEIMVEDSDEVIGSANFTMIVEPSPLQGAVLSDSDMAAAEQCVALIGRAEAAAEAAEDAAERAEGTVTGTIDWNGRNGHVMPAASDYTAAMVDYGNETVKDALDDLITTVGTHTSQIASLDSLKAPKASPAFTGTPTAPTPNSGTNDTTIPTTKWVKDRLDNFKADFDSSLSGTSQNAVRNSVIKAALDGKANTSHTHSAATQSAAGFLSAADKIILDQVIPKTYNRMVEGTALVTAGNQTRCWIFARSGNYAVVIVSFKWEVQNANCPANTTLMKRLPSPQVINPCCVMSTPAGSSTVVGYINQDGDFKNLTQMTSGSTYYGQLMYVSNDATDWYGDL